ncbi:MAG TPA: NlpC/P60 family protein [Thiobacillaceae bacterium]|nr:NlpC/P60 family protein [Thiobacillaceae bacterium]
MPGQKKLLALLSILLTAGPSWAAGIEPQGPDDLFMYAASLVGTPYQFAGANPADGLDCSGFVRHVFMQIFRTELPHSAIDMSREGEAVEVGDLRSGDLVFFNTLERPFSHVGIYLGEDRFVHASSSSTGNVMISSLHEPYWSKRYAGARRIVPTLFVANQP